LECHGIENSQYMRLRAAVTARVGGCLNDPREKGSSLGKTEAQPGRIDPPVHAARRFDAAHVAMLHCNVKRLLRGAVIIRSFLHWA
jgi:hypothetical protein